VSAIASAFADRIDAQPKMNEPFGDSEGLVLLAQLEE
jgi:hypothetical protein